MSNKKIISIIKRIPEDQRDGFFQAAKDIHLKLRAVAEIISISNDDADEQEGGEPFDTRDLTNIWSDGDNDDGRGDAIPDAGDDDDEYLGDWKVEDEGAQYWTGSGDNSDNSVDAIEAVYVAMASHFERGGLEQVGKYLGANNNLGALKLGRIDVFIDPLDEVIGVYGFRKFLEEDGYAGILDSYAPPAPPTPVGVSESRHELRPDLLPKNNYKYKIKSSNQTEQGSLSGYDNLFLGMDTSNEFFKNNSKSYSELLSSVMSIDPNASPLTFHPAFSRLGANAIPMIISDEDSSIIFREDVIDDVKGSVLKELSNLAANVKRNIYSSPIMATTTSAGFKSALKGLDSLRRVYSFELDDIMSAIWHWDKHVYSIAFKAGQGEEARPHLISTALSDNSGEMFQSILSLTMDLLCPKRVSGTDRHMLKDKTVRETMEKWWERYERVFLDQFSEKIDRHIQGNIANDSHKPFTLSIKSGWTPRTVWRNISKQDRNETVQSDKIVKCSICGITKRTKKVSRTHSGEAVDRRKRVDKAVYSDYDEMLYSLVREADGSIITREDLIGPNTEPHKYDPPEGLGGQATWQAIEALISNGSEAEHAEGVARRSSALRAHGGRAIGRGRSKRPVADNKHKCPYSHVSAREECGLTLDPSSLFTSDGKPAAPEFLQSIRQAEGSTGSRKKFTSALSEAVSSGRITESQSELYLDELTRRKAGGWKFSNTYFRCPARVVIPAEDRTYEAFESKGYQSKFSYLATPLSGPITGNNISNGLVQPPLNPDGTPSHIEDGTLSYYVCGEQTSLSSFLRDENAEGSLPSILSGYIGAGENSQPEFVANLIYSLIDFGVDVADILPFVSRNIEQHHNLNMDEKLYEEAMSLGTEDAADELDKSGRLNRISEILVTAMAEVARSLEIKAISMPHYDTIKEVKLVCLHGHRFSIGDSVEFGRTHTGLNMSLQRGMKVEWRTLVESGALWTEGKENFDATVKLNGIKGTGPLFEKVDGENISLGMVSFYDDWARRRGSKDKGIKRSHNKLAFEHAEWGSYRFTNLNSKTYLWGERLGVMSSSRPRTIAEEGSNKVIRSDFDTSDSPTEAAEGVRGGSVSSDAAAKDRFDEAEREGRGVGAQSDHLQRVVRASTSTVNIIRSFIINIQDWLAMSASLDVRGAMIGKPVFISSTQKAHKDSGVGNFLALAGEIIKLLITNIDEYSDDMDRPKDEDEAILSGAITDFGRIYGERLRGLDLNFLGLWNKAIGPIQDESIMTDIVSATINAANRISPGSSSRYAAYFDNPANGVASLLRSEGILKLLGDFRAALAPSLDEESHRRVLSGPEDSKGKKKSEYDVSKVTKMKGRHYMGRVLQASAAFYLADALNKTYNKHMRYPYTRGYIGYDIGIDLSSVSSILKINAYDINPIEAYVKDKLSGDPAIEIYLHHATDCLKRLKLEMFRLRSAATSELYMSQAVKYIRDELTEVVAANQEQPDGALAKRIIDNVMTTSPITTISLNADGKSAKHFGSSAAPAADPTSMVPFFRAYTARPRVPHINFDSYPIYVLAYQADRYSGFKFSESLIRKLRPTERNQAYVMAKQELPESVELADLQAELPEHYRNNGWKIYSVSGTHNERDASADADDHYYIPKKGKATNENGFSRGVSLVYHPGTAEVTYDDGSVMGYRNSDLNYDSLTSLQIGPQGRSRQNTSASAFPPHPIRTISRVGLQLPIEPRTASMDSGEPWGSKPTNPKWVEEVPPIVSVGLPVTLAVPGESRSLVLDLSYFLQRTPAGTAYGILKEIDDRYSDMKEEIEASNEASEPSIRDRYVRAISKLHVAYRSLAYHTETGQSSTGRYPAPKPSPTASSLRSGQSGKQVVDKVYLPRNSMYLPLVDFTTMQRMTSPNNPQFGPEYGGHSLWSRDSNVQDISDVVAAVEGFLIGSNNLDSLAKHISRKLGGDRAIDPSDLLDPLGRLFGKNVVTREEAIKLFGYDPGVYDDGRLPWSNEAGEKSFVKNKSGGKYFEDWKAESGSHYGVGTESGRVPSTGDPDAFIKFMNTIFVPEKAKALIRKLKDPDSDVIMSQDFFFAHHIMIGDGARKAEYYPVPKDEKKFKRFMEALSKVSGIAAIKQVDALSEYLSEHVSDALTNLSKESGFRRTGLIKYSKSLERDIYYGGIIESERLMALWAKLTK